MGGTCARVRHMSTSARLLSATLPDLDRYPCTLEPCYSSRIVRSALRPGQKQVRSDERPGAHPVTPKERWKQPTNLSRQDASHQLRPRATLRASIHHSARCMPGRGPGQVDRRASPPTRVPDPHRMSIPGLLAAGRAQALGRRWPPRRTWCLCQTTKSEYTVWLSRVSSVLRRSIAGRTAKG